MSKRTLIPLSFVLTILCMAGCASVPTCKPVPPSEGMKVPAPQPQIFSRCLREILALADNQVQMSEECSTFLRLAPMR